jgi:hypothetical protein
MSQPPVPPGEVSGNVLFYSRPEPLTFEQHGKMGVNSVAAPFKFAAKGHAIPLTVSEFNVSAGTGPIIFVGEEKMPLLVMGLNANENLFVRPDGVIEAGAYIPAYIRRYPFVFANDETNSQMVLCVDMAAEFVVEGGEVPFFDADGQPSEYTKNCLDFCNSFELERQRTVSFVKLLNDLDLFELKTATYQPPAAADGTVPEPQKIAEYYGVSEEKLNNLQIEKLLELRFNGALPQIYAHLLSLVGWDRLVAIASGRQLQQAPQAANA